MTLSMGIIALSRTSVRVEEPFSPIFLSSAPVDTPGYSFSIMKQLNCLVSTCAKVTNMSANAAFVIHIFSPLMTQCDPSALRTAFVFAPSASEPLPASESAYAAIFSALHNNGRYFRLCSSLQQYTIGRVPMLL